MAEQPGDRGRNWFAVELTSAFVDPGTVVVPAGLIYVTNAGAIASAEEFSTDLSITLGPAPPPPEPDITVRGGPVPDSSQMVQAGPGYIRQEFDAEIELRLPEPEPVQLSEAHDAVLALEQPVSEAHEAGIHLSNLMLTVRRDDEDLMLLF